MRNIDQYRPTKFRVDSKGRLRAGTDVRELGGASRLIAELVAGRYDRALKHHARGRLIDLGCGKVPLYVGYAKYVDEVHCVDWEGSFSTNIHLDATQDLTKPLRLDDGAFDTVILSDVLEHIPTPDALISETGRILRRGGTLIMNVPFLYGLHEMPYDYYRYTESALRRFAENAGLQVVTLDPIGGSVEVFADLAAKHIAQLPVIGGACAVALQHLVAVFSKSPIGQRAIAYSGRRFPLGYFMVAQK
jgi:SAM-dependent methyltransferase